MSLLTAGVGYTIPPSANPPVNIPGLVADQASPQGATINTFLSNNGPGTYRVPGAASAYMIETDILVGQGQLLELGGSGRFRNPGSATPAPGNWTAGAVLAPAVGHNIQNGVVVLNAPGASLLGGTVCAYGVTGPAGTSLPAIRAVWRNSIGTLLERTMLWGGSAASLHDPGQQIAQDSRIFDVAIWNNITTPTVTALVVTAAVGAVLTFAATTGVVNGAPAIDVTNPSFFGAGTSVVSGSITATQLTLNQAPSSSPVGDTILFFSGIGGGNASDDNTTIAGLHCQYAPWLAESSDVRYSFCHFSEAHNGAVAVSNHYHNSGQGSEYIGCTWDNGGNPSSPAHIDRIRGPMNIVGGRFQAKTSSGGGFPIIKERNLDITPTTINDTLIPAIGATVPFTALIAYTTAGKTADSIQGVTQQGNAQCTNLTTGGFPGTALGNTKNGAPWSPGPPITVQTLPANPAATTSTVRVMMGLAAGAGPSVYTPVSTGNVLVRFTGQYKTATAATTALICARFGTGAAPANGAAETGTAIGTGPFQLQAVAINANGDFVVEGLVSGQTLGTALWFDISLGTGAAADAASILNVTFIIQETN